jgi:molybdate transport system substrate-binding protein
MSMKRLVAALCVLAAAPAHARELTVFAAASLRETFTALAHDLEARTPGLTVRLAFAGSQELRTQLDHGARADVFAAAEARHLAGLAVTPRVFAHNQPVVVVPADNPARLAAFADLATAKRIVIGAPEVPIGAYTLQILDHAGADFAARVLARVVSRELNVRQVLAKVELGEADAAVVYRTDALSAGDKVRVVAIPAELNVVAAYPVAVLPGAAEPALAQAFVDLLVSPEGQKRFAAAGFAP